MVGSCKISFYHLSHLEKTYSICEAKQSKLLQQERRSNFLHLRMRQWGQQLREELTLVGLWVFLKLCTANSVLDKIMVFSVLWFFLEKNEFFCMLGYEENNVK